MLAGGINKILNLIPLSLRTRIKYIPVIKQIQSLIVNNYLKNSEFVAEITSGPAAGLFFPVKLPQDKQMWIGTWELEFAQAIKNAVKPGAICYDIGGYKGYYAGIMALNGAKEVYVFEPVPENAVKIKQLISLNPKLPIQLKQQAVSNNNKPAVFKIMKEETMGKLQSSSFQSLDVSVHEFVVDCVSLDELIQNGYPMPDLIKIDVEGVEELVLKGAMSLLKEKKPYLMIEVHSPEIGKACYELLRSIYATIIVFETGKIPQNGEKDICHYLAY